MRNCPTEQDFTSEVTLRLKNFGLAQQELVRELLAAKPLGICKITTSPEGKRSFKSLDSIWRNGNDTMKIDIILTKNDPEEGT